VVKERKQRKKEDGEKRRDRDSLFVSVL